MLDLRLQFAGFICSDSLALEFRSEKTDLFLSLGVHILVYSPQFLGPDFFSFSL